MNKDKNEKDIKDMNREECTEFLKALGFSEREGRCEANIFLMEDRWAEDIEKYSYDKLAQLLKTVGFEESTEGKVEFYPIERNITDIDD